MTRPQAELAEIAFQFVSDCRIPQSSFEHAAELEQLGSHGARIPPMRAHTWKAILDILLTDGRLIERGGCLVAPPKQNDEQMMLF